MAFQWSVRTAVAALILAWLGSAFGANGTQAQASGAFSGRASAAIVRVPATGVNLNLADTGALAGSNLGKGAALLSADVPGSLTAGLVRLTAAPLHGAFVAADQ